MGVDIFHFEKTLWLPRGEMANWEASGQADRGQLAWARHWGDGTFGENRGCGEWASVEVEGTCPPG